MWSNILLTLLLVTQIGLNNPEDTSNKCDYSNLKVTCLFTEPTDLRQELSKLNFLPYLNYLLTGNGDVEVELLEYIHT